MRHGSGKDAQEGSTEVHPATRRPRRVPVALLALMVLVGGALVAEHQSSNLTPEKAASRGFFATQPASPRWRTSSAFTRQGRPSANTASSNASPETQARSFASRGMAEATQIGFTSGRLSLCARILQIKARIDAQINALIARFPSSASTLTTIRNSFDAQINRLLVRLGCPNTSG